MKERPILSDEETIIRFIKRFFKGRIERNTIIPFGDDSFSVKTKGKFIVLNSDMLVAETDVPEELGFYYGGWKFVTMNVSDLAAKGVAPRYFIMSLGIPRSLDEEKFVEFLRGMRDCMDFYDIYLIGGDTNEACDFIASGTVLGYSEGNLMLRKGASPGDYLLVTGDFGNTAAAFKIILEGVKCSEGLKERILKSVSKPVARIEEGLKMAKCGLISSCIDSSDGLSRSLYELMRANGFGFKVSELPVSELTLMFSKETSVDVKDLVFYGGEEYELVFTVKREKWKDFIEYSDEVGIKYKKIGEVIEERKVLFEVEGKLLEVKEGGWIHFDSKRRRC
ncbi:MAG: thiamine-phosphate kinase [Candidatus Asgardarchaeia archaeon]